MNDQSVETAVATVETAVEVIQAEQTAVETAAAEERTNLENAAVATLKSIVSTFRKGEKAFRDSMLKSGSLCLRFLHQRIQLGANRANVIQNIEGQLALYATTMVDANRMIRTSESFRLLSEAHKISCPDVPYGVFREHFTRLVDRHNADTKEESYGLLAGMEAECIECFATAVRDKLDIKAIGDKVSAIVREHTARRAAIAKEAAKKQADETAKAKADAEAARKATAEAEAKARQAEVDAQKAQSDTGTETGTETADKLVAAAEEAAATLRATQEAEIVANQHAALELQKAADAESERKAAEKALKNQADKDIRKAQTALDNQAKRPSPESRQGESYLRAKNPGTAKDTAEWAAELIKGCDQPDTAFLELLRLLDNDPDMGKATQRAVKAALLSLTHSANNPTTMKPQTVSN